jgi:hypothetical protein
MPRTGTADDDGLTMSTTSTTPSDRPPSAERTTVHLRHAWEILRVLDDLAAEGDQTDLELLGMVGSAREAVRCVILRLLRQDLAARREASPGTHVVTGLPRPGHCRALPGAI